MTVVQALSTVMIATIGLWLAHSYRRQLKLRLSEHMIGAYAKLWEITEPLPADKDAAETIDLEEIARHLDAWYYKDGAGMLGPIRTRQLVFALKRNLTCPPDELSPEKLRSRITDSAGPAANAIRICAYRRQASLLRSQLKKDLVFYTDNTHVSRLRVDEIAFLRECRAYSMRRRFGELMGALRPGEGKKPIHCSCGTCPPPG